MPDPFRVRTGRRSRGDAPASKPAPRARPLVHEPEQALPADGVEQPRSGELGELRGFGAHAVLRDLVVIGKRAQAGAQMDPAPAVQGHLPQAYRAADHRCVTDAGVSPDARNGRRAARDAAGVRSELGRRRLRGVCRRTLCARANDSSEQALQAAWPGLEPAGDRGRPAAQTVRRRRAAQPRTARPAVNNAMLPGSGTAVTSRDTVLSP